MPTSDAVILSGEVPVPTGKRIASCVLGVATAVLIFQAHGVVAQPPATAPADAAKAAIDDATRALPQNLEKSAAEAGIKPDEARGPIAEGETGAEFTCVSHVDPAQLGVNKEQQEARARKFAQDHCIAKYFGPSFVTSVTTQAGIAFAGMTARHHKPLWGAAVNASLPVLWSWRIKALTSKLFDPTPERQPVHTLTLPYTRFHQTWFDAGLEPAVLTMTTFNNNQDIAVSTAVLVNVGIRRTYTWWSDPENFASRNSFGVALSAFGGWGQIKPKDGAAYPGVLYGIRVGLGAVQQ